MKAPAILAVLLAGAVPAHAQEPPDVDAAIERFAGLDFRRKAVVLRTVQRQLAQLDDPALRRIAGLKLDVTALPEAPSAPPIHDPADYARDEHDAGRAPSRRVVPADAPAHRAVRERFARPAFLPDLIAQVRYDWTTGEIVRGPELGYDELFANAARGWAPGTDQAIAVILNALDRSGEQRALAKWFGHAYCDLGARAFPPVTLYDAWYSGEIVDVPDVDAIPFAWDILGWKRYRSPLSGPPRDRLYEEIRRAALRHRKHRTLCEAAAAAFVRAEPVMDPTYARLVPRFHYLWSTSDDDLGKLAAILDGADRDQLLEAVDTKIRQPEGTDWAIREARRTELEEMQQRVTAIALAALERFGG